ncbi:DUF2541 family protein [bacterium]|nr:DUF2541 family protein [bacterium]
MKSTRITAALLVLCLGIAAAAAQAPRWKQLGVRKVTFRTEKDVIEVGADEGVYKKIKLTVRQSGVNFTDMKVHFANGDVIDVQIRKVIPAGGETRAIDLPGNNRIIKKVVFWYASTKANSKRATVRLYGLK